MNNRLHPRSLGKFLLLSVAVSLFVMGTFRNVKAQQTCGGEISYGQVLQQENREYWPHCDYWFQGNAGDWVEIRVDVLSGNLMPWIGLIGPDNRYIAASSTGQLHFQLNRDTGRYGFRVTSAVDPRTYGTFRLSLQQARYKQAVTALLMLGNNCAPRIHIQEIYQVAGQLWVISEFRRTCSQGYRGTDFITNISDTQIVVVVSPLPVIHFIYGHTEGMQDDKARGYYYSYSQGSVRQQAVEHGVRYYPAIQNSSLEPEGGSVWKSVQTITGNYLTAIDGGGRSTDAIHTDATQIREWERFKLINLGNGWYAIQTITGNYLTAVGGGGRLTDVIHTDATQIREWEKFKLISLGNGWYAIQTITGNYLTAVDGGGRFTNVIHTDATQIREWEKFRLVN
ncbi:MAG: hypothetical protein U0350_16360 [Caldilineaceae bacterium]